MLCPSCGVPAASPTQKFCAECGVRLGQSCPSCSTAYDGSPKFCPECGFALAAGTRPPIAPSSPLAGNGATAIPIESAASTVAERKLVSVLFADLVGFTASSESRDAEAVREQLTEYFGVAQEIITRYGGSVEKFIGDAVMAVFGLPTLHEDDALRAVRAAHDLRAELKSSGLA
ncbi:MAG: zinc ribbon domain-containing protein, partial [Chloroflexota bacterium]|nr:zinc ribbon domain-containing protein [Chloroflexota bacterium]